MDVLWRMIEHVIAVIAKAVLMHCAVIKCNHYYRGAVITFSVGEPKTIVLKWSET